MENVWRQFRAIDVFVKLDSKENNVHVRAKSLKLFLNIYLGRMLCGLYRAFSLIWPDEHLCKFFVHSLFDF